MSNNSQIIPVVEDALSSSPTLFMHYIVSLDCDLRWTLSRDDSTVSTAITEADALRIINHISLFNNGKPAFRAITH